MERSSTKPSAWLATLPESRRAEMKRLDKLIAQRMKGHGRVLWEGTFWGGSEQTIIGYGDLDFTNSRGKTVPWFMVGLALQKQHISIYVNAVDGRQYAAEKFARRLGKVKVGKASVSFGRVADVDLDVLCELLDLACRQLEARNA